MLTRYLEYYLRLDPAVVGAVADALTLLGAIGLVMLLRPRPAPSPSEVAAWARRHATIAHVTACTLGVAAGLALDVLEFRLRRDPGPGISTLSILRWILSMAWPLTVGLTYLGIHALGAWRWPRPDGSLRRATLVPREDPTPRRLQRLAPIWVGLTTVALLIQLAVLTAAGHVHWSFAVSDAVIVATGLALLGATRGVVAVVRDRISLDGPPDLDAAARRLTAHRVLRGVQLVLGLTTALQFLSVTMLLSSYRSRPWPELPSNIIAITTLVIAALTLITSVVASFLPARARRDRRRARRAAAPPAVDPPDDPAAAPVDALTREAT